jgi:hypothetical protein
MVKGSILAVAILIALVIGAGMLLPGSPRGAATSLQAPKIAGNSRPMSEAETRLGVQIESVRVSAAGYMLDLRYRIIDSSKAKPLTEGSFKPYLIDETSGGKLIVPAPAKVGPLRSITKSAQPVAGRIYFVIFANPGRLVKSGGKVTLVVGDMYVGDLSAV